MSVAAPASKEDKVKWLMRPFNWAYDVACGGLISTTVTYFEGGILHGYSAFVGMGTLAGVSALLLWGFHRMSIATRGY